jgi:hypothetical protein
MRPELPEAVERLRDELAAKARRDLVERADGLLRADAARFDALIEGGMTEADGLARLHAAIDAVRRAS